MNTRLDKSRYAGQCCVNHLAIWSGDGFPEKVSALLQGTMVSGLPRLEVQVAANHRRVCFRQSRKVLMCF